MSRIVAVDGNEAVARVAHLLSEVVAIYPITPASAMGELADDWSCQGRKNLWGLVPKVVEMQSEAGAIGAVHGSLQAGSLTTTFTASQGLLLMIPTLYKIAGELTSFTLHVAARTVATHALSIFGDHSDVMACRQTGFAMLAAGSVQEAQDFAAVAHAASLESRVPFLHFFDGFRTSHEINTIDELPAEALEALIDDDAIVAHRQRALDPDAPFIRGTAQNPDAFFQAREACNPFYEACPGIVQQCFARFAELTGRRYELFQYHGHPEAERIIVLMGSGAKTAAETARKLAARGDKVGVVEVRLYRPFHAAAFLAALPATTRSIAVLDRTKEPGAGGEPLYLDCFAAIGEAAMQAGRSMPRIIGGRYGLSSKEFSPAMVARIFAELDRPQPKTRFTIGIKDDVTHLSLDVEEELHILGREVNQGIFFGLGSDGTVGANKNSIKIIADVAQLKAQAYFVYDSKKSGAVTTSHLRFGKDAVQAPYLIEAADFIGCHQYMFVDKVDVLERARPGGIFLLNAPYGPEEVFATLPVEMQRRIIDLGLEFYCIDAYKVADEAGMGNRINTVMQTAFFAISNVIETDRAIEAIKDAIRKTYGKKGHEIIKRNVAAVDSAVAHLHRVVVPAAPIGERQRPPVVPAEAPEFIQRVTATIMAGKGDLLPVSAFPADGTFPSSSARWERRNIARSIPAWNPDICIQCNKCALMCPHAAIRAGLLEPELAASAPGGFKTTEFRSRDLPDKRYVIQVAPEDCTGCTLCVEVCPARDKANPRVKALGMVDKDPILDQERANWDFFTAMPTTRREDVVLDHKGTQFLQPLFECSGACAGCGETPYVKLLSQLYGDRLVVANATGCSSIYGGNLPTTPWSTDAKGRGPAWSNSLFENNAEFGLGFRLSWDTRQREARALVEELREDIGLELAGSILTAPTGDDAAIEALRGLVERLEERLRSFAGRKRHDRLAILASSLVPRSVWLVGGDGWAYDIGFGGLDHVIASGENVNILVLDTEVYSNTGGQASKATPMAAAAKFAAAGKAMAKKDLGMVAMSYGGVYVAQIAIGAKDSHAVKAIREAESYPGPSLVIAYSHCIAHGYDLAQGAEQQKAAVKSYQWPLYRYDPRRGALGEPPLVLDSGPPSLDPQKYMAAETRFRVAEKIDPARYRMLVDHARDQARRKYELYRQLAGVAVEPSPESHA
ncbi:MAG: pyruvate:ferredoxin (flavodoxin) oxidoreductase [Planctomycetes bacterium]|nr:pyruvate:ferredoxin (flavodoxin) oxidoreductase [Planctomycetota bacterium]